MTAQRSKFALLSSFTLDKFFLKTLDISYRVMVELAFYPAVALIYFFAVMDASKSDRIELDDRASVNVFCLFVLVQPLCLVFGGYTGMAAYLLTALVSYNFLPWKKRKQIGKEAKKTK
ncbi:uncharacterized protein LOC144076324 [Stigmatopora argus]